LPSLSSICPRVVGNGEQRLLELDPGLGRCPMGYARARGDIRRRDMIHKITFDSEILETHTYFL
jgi:hypothetical protein